MSENSQKCGIPHGGYYMSGKKNMWVTLGFVISASLIAAAVSVLFVSYHYSRLQFDLLNAVCGEVMEQEPETGKIITAALKVYAGGNPDGAVEKMCYLHWDTVSLIFQAPPVDRTFCLRQWVL